MRRNRFAIEDLTRQAGQRLHCGVLVVTIDDLEPQDAAAARLTPTLDSLRAVGREVVIRDLPVSRDEATRALIAPLVHRAGELGHARSAVIGSELSAEQAEAWSRVFDAVRNDLPRITRFLREGEATWVSLEAVRELSASEAEPIFLWLLYSELSAPHLRHERFRIPDGRTSELVAIDHYLGKVLEYLRAAGCGGRTRVVLGSSDPAPDGHLKLWLVGAGAPDTVSVEKLSAVLFPPRE